VTSTTDAGRHPDVAEISALADGLLTPERTAAVRSHVDGCGLCADVRSCLEEIHDTLGALPGPAQMPADVASRIDAALAAEALLDATASGTVSRETVDGPARPAEDRPVSRETGDRSEPVPVAHATSRPKARRRAVTGPGRAPLRGRRWRAAVLGAASVLGIGIGGVVVMQSLDPAQEGHDAAAQSRTAEADSGLTGAALENRVQELLETAKSPPNEVGAQSGPAEPLRGSDVTVPSCIRNGIDHPGVPLAAGEDVFEGKDAYIVVLTNRSDATRVDAYVVDSSCVEASSGELGDVLLTRTYPRR